MEEILKPKTSKWDEYVPIITNGRHTDVYLTDIIEAPSVYNELMHLLANAYSGDSFKLHINNGGGYADTAFMLVEAIRTTKAKVTAKLSGTVASSATIITMACRSVEIAPHTSFMIHNYSGGASGKGNEIKAQVDFTDSELNKAFIDIYGGFLTESEMELVIAGKDYWMGREEVLRRWKAFTSEDTILLEEIAAERKKGK
jgi:ATP-dependent protease ClpP protease subunit